MKKISVRFTPEAAQCISRLHPNHKRIIREALDELRQDPYAGDDLQDELAEFKSYKPKRFRIIYSVDDDSKIIQVFHVGHRRDVYDQFRLLLANFKS
ncbi:MAG: type II toxin-antitoxin system RelE/ParE family toxin [Deltaproteobacteria bacterium]|nr:type II toxin-antitoxin system RelE/ParE family toxin [Deltaproteobacteria bacterium]